MKKFLSAFLALLLVLSAFAGCTDPETLDTTTADVETTTAPADDATTTEPADDGATTTVAPDSETTTADPDGETTTAGPGWEADTGVFNDGIVDYEVLVETAVHNDYPDDKIGEVMNEGDVGVVRNFYSDFSDDDPTCLGVARPREPDQAKCINGVLYLPYEATSPNFVHQSDWTTWAPTPSSSVKTYKQAQLSVDWTVTTECAPTNSNSTSAMWGCYVSNYTGSIANKPGDGLWLAFQPVTNVITIYHPDENSWSRGWVSVPVADEMLSEKHHLDIVTTPDYSTYVYITPEGDTTPRLVCTVLFRNGMIRAYNEAGDLVAESACTTDSLAGDHYVVFPHGGAGALIDEIALYAATEGGTVVVDTTVKATPTEGHSLGLDITNKTDLVSICYSVWFDAILGMHGDKAENWNNIADCVAGLQDWGPEGRFHYWGKPEQGYYCSSNVEVIRTHMTQLYTAGVDFIIVDWTNMGDTVYPGTAAWDGHIESPMTAICDTIMQMRAEGLGTPYVVFWAGTSNDGSLYRNLYDYFYAREEWKDCFVYWDDKPFMITTQTYPEDFPYPELMTVRRMWGLHPATEVPKGSWTFLSLNNYAEVARDKDGNAEQMCVCVASQSSVMTKTATAQGRQGGMFWYAQWREAFKYRPKIVTLTWWNEWTAQRKVDENGNNVFVDAYTTEYSRDIEPMQGGHGDMYYRWMIDYISAYKGHLDCPVLIRSSYSTKLTRFLKSYEAKGILLEKARQEVIAAQ